MMNGLKIYITIVCLLFSSVCTAKKKQSTLPEIKRVQTSFVIDADSGKVLHDVNGAHRIYPASLTKLMTLYLAFEALQSNKMSINDELVVSRNAENMKPSKIGLKAGETITAKNAILALIVKSANDAAVVIAEALAKDEKSFAQKMTRRAHQLGMKNSHFYNASGWHHPEQKTTASDLAKLTMAIKRDFPEFYPWFSKDQFVYNGRTIMGHNKVARTYPGAEGMKTGYTSPAGFNLVTTALRNGKRLIGVVTGSPAAATRDAKMKKLLDVHFANLGVTNNVFESQSAKNNISKKASRIGSKNTKKTIGHKKINKSAKTLRV